MKKNKRHRVKFHPSYSFDVLVLDAESRQSLVTIQSLGEKGFIIAALGNFNKNIPAFASKFCHLSIPSPFEEGTEEYIQFLLQFLRQHRVKVVIPAADGTIAILRKYRKKLQKYTSLAIASEKAMDIAVNKNRTLAVAQKLGIRIPKSISITNRKQFTTALKKITFPIVVKPVESWTEGLTGRKRVCPILANTKQEAYRAFEEITEFGGEIIIQEYLTGIREAVSLVYSKKQIYATFVQWAKRTQPPMGGTSVLRQSVAIPRDIYEQAEKLIKTINIEGYSEVEFRRDKNGIAYLMEINPRLSMSVDIAVRSGIDFPYALYQWANGEKIKKMTKYTSGKWERYLAGDIICTLESLQENPSILPRMKILLDFISTFFQPMYYDYVNWQDILPAINATWDFVVRNIHKLTMQSTKIKFRNFSRTSFMST